MNEKGIPADLQAICDALRTHADFASWWDDLQYLTGDFDLEKVQKDTQEVWRGRCGGFADYFLTEAAGHGYGSTMYYAALPKHKINLLSMHFFGVAEKDGRKYLLDVWHTSDGEAMVAVKHYVDDEEVLFRCQESFVFVHHCFSTSEPLPANTIAYAGSSH